VSIAGLREPVTERLTASMHIESTQPWVEAKLKIPISKRIKDVVGRVAGKAGILDRDFRSKMVIVAFHRISDTLPEGGLNYSSARFEKFCEFCKSRFKVIPLSEQVAATLARTWAARFRLLLMTDIGITTRWQRRFCASSDRPRQNNVALDHGCDAG